MLPLKNVSMGNSCRALPWELTHVFYPMLPCGCTSALPPPHLNLFRSPRVSMLPLKKCNGQHRTSSLGLTYASRMMLPIKSLTDVPPPMQ